MTLKVPTMLNVLLEIPPTPSKPEILDRKMDMHDRNYVTLFKAQTARRKCRFGKGKQGCKGRGVSGGGGSGAVLFLGSGSSEFHVTPPSSLSQPGEVGDKEQCPPHNNEKWTAGKMDHGEIKQLPRP